MTAMLSRMYGFKDVDVILNSTGGNVILDKWYKYNKVRAIENSCFNFVTMGGNGKVSNPNSYVYGFNPNGKELKPYNIMKKTMELKAPNKNYHVEITIGGID